MSAAEKAPSSWLDSPPETPSSTCHSLHVSSPERGCDKASPFPCETRFRDFRVILLPCAGRGMAQHLGTRHNVRSNGNTGGWPRWPLPLYAVRHIAAAAQSRTWPDRLESRRDPLS